MPFKKRNEWSFPSGENHPGWHGGFMIREGRVYLRAEGHPFASVDGGHYVLRYRLIMEDYLTKQFGYKVFLDPKLIVHHINHNKQDDIIENLRIVTPSEHMRSHPEILPRIPNDRRCDKCGSRDSDGWKIIDEQNNKYWCRRCLQLDYDRNIRKPRHRENGKWVLGYSEKQLEKRAKLSLDRYQ